LNNEEKNNKDKIEIDINSDTNKNDEEIMEERVNDKIKSKSNIRNIDCL
jgi:hypothetical protein